MTQNACDQICENECEDSDSPIHKKHFLLLLKSVSSPGERISEFISTEADEKDNPEGKVGEKKDLETIKLRKLSASAENSEIDSE